MTQPDEGSTPPRGSRRAVAIGLGVLAAWLALFYAGLAWFLRKARGNREP